MRKRLTITVLSAALVVASALPATSAAATGTATGPRLALAMPKAGVAQMDPAVTLVQRSRYKLRLRRPFGRRGTRSRSYAPARPYGGGTARPVLPLSRIAPRVLAVVPGQLRGGHLIGRYYLIKILSRSGRLVYVYADARTGRIARIRR